MSLKYQKSKMQNTFKIKVNLNLTVQLLLMHWHRGLAIAPMVFESILESSVKIQYWARKNIKYCMNWFVLHGFPSRNRSHVNS